MKKTLITFLQIVVVLFGILVFVFMLWEPHLEGRNVNATVFQVYFNDPFLVYAYVSSILFFTVLYQIHKVLGYVKKDNAFSSLTMKSLQTIKNCVVAMFFLVLGGMTYSFVFIRGEDDIAGGMAIGLFLILSFSITFVIARYLERRLQNIV